MRIERVLVIMQATKAKTESMALAFGLGAVEGGANIRLRHLAGATPTALEHRGYGRLSDKDLEWAEVIGLALEASESTEELSALLKQVEAFPATADVSRKSVYIFSSAEKTNAVALAAEAFRKKGFTASDTEPSLASGDVESIKSASRKIVS